MRNRYLIAGLLLLALAALAWGTSRAQVVYAGNVQLSADTRQRGDLLVFSGNVMLPAGARVDGSLLVLCCNLQLDGVVAQDLYLVTGNLRLGPEARVGGEIGTTAANTDIAPTAVVEGERAGPGFWLALLRATVLAPALALGGAGAAGLCFARRHSRVASGAAPR